MTRSKISEWAADIIRRQGSIAEAARSLGVSRSTVRRWRDGEAAPKPVKRKLLRSRASRAREYVRRHPERYDAFSPSTVPREGWASYSFRTLQDAIDFIRTMSSDFVYYVVGFGFFPIGSSESLEGAVNYLSLTGLAEGGSVNPAMNMNVELYKTRGAEIEQYIVHVRRP